VLTVSIKQVLVLAMLGPAEIQEFVDNLMLYTGFSQSGGPPAAYFSAFVNLFKYTPLLTYYSIPGAVALLLASALAWARAAYLALRPPRSVARSIFLAHVVAASGIALWVLILPTHTAIHGFMVRMLVVPFALGWSALVLQTASRKHMIEGLSPRES
jgi:hypothetical protein